MAKRKVTRKSREAKDFQLPELPKAKMGRPLSIENHDQLKVLMRFKPTLVDTAAFFNCSVTTVEVTIKTNFNQTFREFRDTYMTNTRLNLQRKGINMALAGNTDMMKYALDRVCGFNQIGTDLEDFPVAIFVPLKPKTET